MIDTRDRDDLLLEQVFEEAAPGALPGDWADVETRMELQRPPRRTLLRFRPLERRPRIGFAKRSWAFRASLAAGVAGAAAIAVMLAPSGGPTPLERAAAAIKVSGPVVHLVWTQENLTNDSILDVSTGQETAAPDTTVTNWYDTETGTFKQILADSGIASVQWRDSDQAVNDAGDEVPAAALPVPAVVALFEHYAQAIEDGDAKIVGDGVLDGQDVVFVDVEIPHEAYTAAGALVGDAVSVERLALDAETYAPVAVLPQNTVGADPSLPVTFHIQSVELVARSAADLAAPAVTDEDPAVVASNGFTTTRQSSALASGDIDSWLGQAPVGNGSALAGLSFAAARGDLLNPADSAEQRGLRLTFGDRCGGSFVVVSESPRPARFYVTTRLDDDGLTLPQVRLSRLAVGDAECGQSVPESLWTARVATGGLFVSIASASKALTIQATRELVG